MWIAVAIAAYFLLAVVAVLDKYLLVGPLPNPRLYAFAVGFFSAVAFILIPFGFLETPPILFIVLGLLAGFFQIFGLVFFFGGLQKFEASKVVPAIGGFLPVFTLVFTALLGRGNLDLKDFGVFALLVGGGVAISIEKKQFATMQSVKYAAVAALFFSFFVVLSKFAYEVQPFLSGLLWIVMGGFLGAFVLLFSRELRREIRNVLQKRGASKKVLSPGVVLLFIGNQGFASFGFVLQNWAIALAPFAYIAFVNALEGVKYVFVLLFAIFLSVLFPKILKEKVSRQVILQKSIAIIVIGAGLVLLAV
jgi:drug/metabolite transporter (DMT)-like permease